MRWYWKPVLLSLASIGLIASNGLAESYSLSSTTPEQQVEDVVSRLEGVMDTSAQAATDPNAPNVQMVTCRVQVESDSAAPNTVFLYQEQALISRLERPYRQRVLQISPSADRAMIQSTSFRPLQPETLIGLCDRPSSQREISLQALDQAHCTVYLRRVGDDYVGQTQLGGCPSNYRGAVRVTNEIVLHPTAMETRDRGFDLRGNQVWGSAGEPYQFQRRNQN